MSQPDNPGVIAPPPLIYGLPLLVGILVHIFIGGMDIGLPALVRWPIGLIALLGGFAIIGMAIERFTRAKTNPEPWKPATTVVVDGVYRLTRNPMYLGMAAAYAGIALILDCWFTLALLPVAMLVVDRGVIVREERYLEAKFGPRFRELRDRTRRWI